MMRIMTKIDSPTTPIKPSLMQGKKATEKCRLAGDTSLFSLCYVCIVFTNGS